MIASVNSLGLLGVRGYFVRVECYIGPGTPIFDIKPYLPYADCRPEAGGGFAPDPGAVLRVSFAEGMEERVPEDKRAALRGVLANDPRPRYQKDSERVYAMDFAELNIRFRVDGEELLVTEIR